MGVSYRFSEGSSGLITTTVTDASGTAVPIGQVVSAFLTLFDTETFDPTISPPRGVINNRRLQDVLNTNGVTVATGTITWQVQPEDNVIVSSRRQIERHRAVFTILWENLTVSPPTGGTVMNAIDIEVVNLQAVA